MIDEAHLLDREALTDLRLLVSSAVEQERQINNIATACLIQAAASNVQRVDESLYQQTTSEFQLL